MKQYILYNPLAGDGDAGLLAELFPTFSEKRFDDSLLIDVTSVGSLADLNYPLAAEDRLVICGGDGTLHRFVNTADVRSIPCEIFYLAAGTGNDFLRDVAPGRDNKPIPVGRYLINLPKVTVNGKTYRFLNNVGFGIDGYCTEVGDALRAAKKKKINYTAIAIKGLLGKFHPVNAKITVDGITRTYRDVWLAPTMQGRCYGGGMIPAPEQDRLHAQHTVSVMVFHTKSRLKALRVFPSIFRGKHVKHRDIVEVYTGKQITVEFDRAATLQIDGETVKNVTKYDVRTEEAADENKARMP